MIRAELEKTGFSISPEGGPFMNGATCEGVAYQILTPENEVDTTRDFAEIQITGAYPAVKMGQYALNTVITETIEITGGSGVITFMRPNGFLVSRKVQVGDVETFDPGTGFKYQPSPGETLELDMICDPPFDPTQYGIYEFDEMNKKFTPVEKGENS